MKTKKIPRKERLLIAIGLILTTTPQMLRSYTTLPDFILGAFVGIGLVLEITAFIRLKRARLASGC